MKSFIIRVISEWSLSVGMCVCVPVKSDEGLERCLYVKRKCSLMSKIPYLWFG